MEEHHHHHHRQPSPPAPTERLIVRSGATKDRHSKVRTSRGLRDRRVRLSAHTAIRFYDVQDRLGFDRPSKAVDWLIRNARDAIDGLPPSPGAGPSGQPLGMAMVSSGERTLQVMESSTSLAGYGFDNSFLATPSLDSDSIAETIKSFFPIPHTAAMPMPAEFHHYPSQALGFGTSNQVHEDLRLSLQSSHHPITTMTTTRTGIDPIAHNAVSTNWIQDNSPRMTSWMNDGSEMSVVMSQGPYFSQRGPLQATEPWISDPNQVQISPFGSGGLANCFHVEEDHDELSNK